MLQGTGCSNLNDKKSMIISWHILTISITMDINSKWGREGGYRLQNTLIAFHYNIVHKKQGFSTKHHIVVLVVWWYDGGGVVWWCDGGGAVSWFLFRL